MLESRLSLGKSVSCHDDGRDELADRACGTPGERLVESGRQHLRAQGRRRRRTGPARRRPSGAAGCRRGTAGELSGSRRPRAPSGSCASEPRAVSSDETTSGLGAARRGERAQRLGRHHRADGAAQPDEHRAQRLAAARGLERKIARELVVARGGPRPARRRRPWRRRRSVRGRARARGSSPPRQREQLAGIDDVTEPRAGTRR